MFFFCWLFWWMVGVMVGRWRRLWWDASGERFACVVLLLVPAFVLQMRLIFHARIVAEVAAFEFIPFVRIFREAWLGNVPVGLVSGLLFILACAWTERDMMKTVAGAALPDLPASAGRPPGRVGVRNVLIVAAVSVYSLFLFQQTYIGWWTVSSSVAVIRADGTPGRSPPVDFDRLRSQIEQGNLSDREALYYDSVEDNHEAP